MAGELKGILHMTKQQPIGSGFGPASTASDVMQGKDLTGRVAIVTGAYSGLGLVTAKALAAAGATVIVPVRDAAKAAQRLADAPELERGTLELIDPASIDSFAEGFLASGKPLHLLINNAGVMASPLARDAAGNESQLAINHLGHFRLTARLWPALRRAGGARVVQLSSLAHARAGVDFDDPNFLHRPYDPWVAYGQSKTANALFALSLDQRGQAFGVNAYSVHPGAIVTDLGRHTPSEDLKTFGMIDSEGHPIIDPDHGRKNPEQGAATTLWAATEPRLADRGGVYCEDCDVARAVPGDTPSGPGVRPWACDPAAAERLWAMSEELTKATIG
jgi:NAD(P)-dependent dehydrogenase (short-subunit alcohol dehydrogenase family)